MSLRKYKLGAGVLDWLKGMYQQGDNIDFDVLRNDLFKSLPANFNPSDSSVIPAKMSDGRRLTIFGIARVDESAKELGWAEAVIRSIKERLEEGNLKKIEIKDITKNTKLKKAEARKALRYVSDFFYLNSGGYNFDLNDSGADSYKPLGDAISQFRKFGDFSNLLEADWKVYEDAVTRPSKMVFPNLDRIEVDEKLLVKYLGDDFRATYDQTVLLKIIHQRYMEKGSRLQFAKEWIEDEARKAGVTFDNLGHVFQKHEFWKDLKILGPIEGKKGMYFYDP